MTDMSTLLQTKLSAIDLPVHFEHFLTKDTVVPCISWRLDDDSSRVKGDNLSFSWINVSVKVWGKDKAVFATYSPLVDTVMRGLGFTRTATNELWATGIGQYEMRYRGTYRENYE